MTEPEKTAWRRLVELARQRLVDSVDDVDAAVQRIVEDDSEEMNALKPALWPQLVRRPVDEAVQLEADETPTA